MIGWRFWELDDHGQLCSPFAGDVLPHDGRHTALCNLPHQPPHPACRCGISFYRHQTDAETVLAKLPERERYAITAGLVIGSVRADNHLSPYRIGGGFHGLPVSFRCAAYQVTNIYTTADALVYTNIPTRPRDDTTTEAMPDLR
ncbi:hypothetical protein SBI67_17855 [Mycolicibacterium sp. 120266]|uniref:hypothetical protein n=1 Tax=Mycolicibacterium sp. 120266 TaxID=3090601 RepID=UPI00299E96F2|nr:hypothetical protein [Mycolicibacterium sp. 120266]MDX1873990.1 hypothetical protein [Mycolicibacterium sp. 120266]